MKNRPVLFMIVVFSAVLSLSFENLYQDNLPPAVKILSPKENTTIKPGASMTYRLSVNDKEDGNSEFDEINVKEVLLEVRYQRTSRTPQTNKDTAGLNLIRGSNCLNCHNFNSKSNGPSFFDISKRYPSTKTNVDSLTKNIQNASTGTWGKEKMPSHPELTVAEIKSTVNWILKNGSSSEISYFNGTDGNIQLPSNKTGFYILTASYMDHGPKSGKGKKLIGRDRVVISVK